MSYQRLIIEGNVGQDPRIKTFDDGGSVAQFNVAVTERGFKTKDGRDIPEHTEWFYCLVRGGMTKIVQQYVHKGDNILLEGKLRTREYIDKDNITRKVAELVVDNISLIGSRTQNTSNQSAGCQDENYSLPF